MRPPLDPPLNMNGDVNIILFAIQAKIGPRGHANRWICHEEVVLARLTCLTHTYLAKNEQSPSCELRDGPLPVIA